MFLRIIGRRLNNIFKGLYRSNLLKSVSILYALVKWSFNLVEYFLDFIFIARLVYFLQITKNSSTIRASSRDRIWPSGKHGTNLEIL